MSSEKLRLIPGKFVDLFFILMALDVAQPLYFFPYAYTESVINPDYIQSRKPFI